MTEEMPMNLHTDVDGRVSGQILMLQMMVAQLYAAEPAGEIILGRLEAFAQGLRPQGHEASKVQNLMTDMATGAQETWENVNQIAAGIRNKASDH